MTIMTLFFINFLCKNSIEISSKIVVNKDGCAQVISKLRYFLGDGDSSVMSKLLEAQPYGPTTHINKVECTNHLLRNYIRKIKEVGEARRNHVGPVPGELRNKVLANILRLRYDIAFLLMFRLNHINYNYISTWVLHSNK